MSGAINMVTAQSSALGVEGNISYYSGMAGAYFSWIRDAGRNGGGIFPGASGNETESACGNPQ